MLNEEIRRRYQSLASHRQVVQQMWDSIERYIAPYRGRFFRDERTEDSIEWQRPFVYDGTAIMGSQALASHLHSSLTSGSVRWFELRFRNEQLMQDNDAVEWLDSCTDQIYKTLNDSNFNIEIAETYQDLVDYGSSIIMEEVKNEVDYDGINFKSVPLKECYFEEDADNNVLNFYRRFDFTPLQLVDKFGDNVPQYIKEMAQDGSTQQNEKQVIIFCIYRRKNNPDVDLTKPIAPMARPWGFKYIMEKDAESVGNEGGYYEMPAFVPRWRTTSDSMWGNSPGMMALADTMTLNKLIELMIAAAEKVIDPPIMATERGLVSDLDLNPGGYTVVKSMDEVAPFESRARFDINYSEIERYRQNIRSYFLLDQLMLPPMEGTPATATEINARVAQLERLIGPTLGRLQTDLLDPVINRTFNILYRAKQLPEMPPSVAEMASDLDVEYLGPLARTLQHHQIDAFDRWVMQIQLIAQVNPEVLDVPDWDTAVREVGYLQGVPAKFMRSKSEIEERRSERQAMAEEQHAAEVQEKTAKADKAESEAVATQSQIRGV